MTDQAEAVIAQVLVRYYRDLRQGYPPVTVAYVAAAIREALEGLADD